MKKRIVVLTGAGISAESGIKTFRDAGGLWEGHDVMKVASPEGWMKDPELVLKFYNERRAQAKHAKPNAGHLALVKLEEKFDVKIVTQNVDDLHEKAGSSSILHLHGQLNQVRSTGDELLVYDAEGDIQLGDTCEKGFQLRPHIVWFGEDVPAFGEAMQLAMSADYFLVVGTSMVVYPAAGLVEYAGDACIVICVDPKKPEYYGRHQIFFVEEPATTGMPKVAEMLLNREA